MSDPTEVVVDMLERGEAEGDTVQLILAQWVADRWPAEGEITHSEAELLNRINWHFGCQNVTIIEWLGRFPGKPAVLATSIRTLNVCKNEAELVSMIFGRYTSAVEERIGISGDEALPILTASIEAPLTFHDLRSAALGAARTLVGIRVAFLAAQAYEDPHATSEVAEVALSHLHSLQINGHRAGMGIIAA